MKIIFSSRSKKQLQKLDLRFQDKITDSLMRFKKGERVDFKKLKGRKEEYRARVGEYRIILKRVEKTVFVVTEIDIRGKIYSIFI